ncbi:MAG TPA: recombinase family protein, partial [Longimicrobium sp.]
MGAPKRGSFIERVRACARMGVGLLIRQSSEKQKEENTGSPAWQRAQIRIVEPHLSEGQECVEYDARGESAKTGANRPVFWRLVNDVRRGKIGIVIVAWADRASRSFDDAEELFDALGEVNGYLVCEGHFYDPNDKNHRLLLRIQIALAEHANEQRRSLSATSKGAKAVALSYRIALPTGLVWGSPDDPEFIEAMNDAGFESELDPVALAQHRVVSSLEGRRYFIFRHPDVEVRRAVSLLLTWMIESRSLSEVIRRVEKNTDWPEQHRGEIPSYPGTRFRRDRPVTWVKTRHSMDRRGDAVRSRLLSWFRSPALYGIYHFRSEVLQEETSEIAREMGGDVWREDAFPAYAPPEALPAISVDLRTARLYPHRGSYTGPDPHRLAEVRCAQPLPNGDVCGLLARPWPRPAGGFYYTNTRCSSRGHTTGFAADLEAAALSIISDGYRTEVLHACLTGIRRAKGAEASRLRDLERKVQTLTLSVETAAARVDKYDAEKAFKDSAYWEERRQARSRELEAALDDHARARRAVDDSSSLAESEFRSILRLATDIPELIRRAGSSPDRMRRLTRALAECVHVRSLGTGVYHVEVEFPSGQRVGRLHVVKRPAAKQALQQLARSRLRA